MSLLQINTAIPLALAQPLLEQHDEWCTERKITSSSRKGEYSSITTNQYRTKFIVLGALTGFFIQVVSLGAYAFLLVHYQFQQGQQHEFEEDNNDASTTTTTATATAALISGFLKQQQNENGNESSSAIQMPYGTTDTIMYTLLSALTQIDLIVYVLIWIAFTCTMTKNGMSCIRSSLFASTTQEEQTATTATTSTATATNTTTNDSKKKKKKIKIIKRRYVFVLGVNFLIGIVLGAFIAWSIIDIYLGFPIPLKPILFTVLIDLMLCYFMICCYDMGSSSSSNSSSKSNGRSKKSKNNKRVEVVENDDNYTDTDSDDTDTYTYTDDDDDDDDDDDNDDDDEDSSSWC